LSVGFNFISYVKTSADHGVNNWQNEPQSYTPKPVNPPVQRHRRLEQDRKWSASSLCM